MTIQYHHLDLEFHRYIPSSTRRSISWNSFRLLLCIGCFVPTAVCSLRESFCCHLIFIQSRGSHCAQLSKPVCKLPPEYVSPCLLFVSPSPPLTRCVQVLTSLRESRSKVCLPIPFLGDGILLMRRSVAQASVSYCRNCERFLAPPAQWMIARPESQELLAICLKKLKGLNRVRLTDAHFIWTEPHSKRLKISLTIQKEVCCPLKLLFRSTQSKSQVLTSTILEQVFEIEYLVQHGQCPDCTKLAAKNTWKALVQVRQKVPHKRTFLYLEQLILKHGAQKDTLSLKEVKDGLDFFYSQRSHALKMVEFLSGVVPIR